MPVIAEQTRVATIYNPQNQTKEQLIDSFVAREKTFQKLFKTIKEAKMEVPEQHYLILGRRGMGKTTLIMRLFYEIEDDAELNSWLIPLVFNEEEYGIRRLFGFWERIMELLEFENPNFRGNETVRKALSKKYIDDDAYERALFDLLSEELKRNGKKIILFVDNFGDLARKFTDAEGHRLRKILQSSAEIRIFASSSIVLDAFYKYDHPFYEFFKVVELQGLNEKETRNLLLSLSQHYKNESVAKMVENHPGRVEALRRITGGVIRTMVLLFEIFADDDDGSAYKDLEKILDRTTPLYKHRMDDLSHQQQAIVEAIALNWDALSVKEIVERTRLDSKTISAQLNNLEKNGIIEKRATTTKNHVYLVAERFFNIWFLMRLGRRGDEKRVLWLVRFFEEWCDNDMMSSRAKMHLEAILKGGFEPEAAFLYTQAFAQSQKLSIAVRHEIINTTRSYLIKNSPELAKDLMSSDLDITFEILEKWFSQNKLDEIEKIIPKFSKFLDNHKIKRLSKIENQDDKINFWIAEMGNIANELGAIYYSLQVPEIDMAIKSWIWAVKVGNSDAMYNLGFIYEIEKKDFEKAIQFYEKAAIAGNSNGMFCLGLFYHFKKKDVGRAIDWYRKAANANNSDAMINLSSLYKNEKNDLKNSFEWLQKAAIAGNSNGLFSLGLFYHIEKKDFEKAIQWYEKAVVSGNSNAMVNLGYIYHIEKNDLEKAIQWYKKSANLGNMAGMVNLGFLYEIDKREYDKAIEWYEKAANAGNLESMVILGYIYEFVKKDVKKAVEWYDKERNSGNSDAMFNLGFIYDNEKKDLTKSIFWYEKAANAGNSSAMKGLARSLFQQKFQKQKALSWIKDALKLNPDDKLNQYTAASIFAWNNDLETSKSLSLSFLKNEEFLDSKPDDITPYFILMISKKESSWLLEQFNSPQGEAVHLKDRFKPIYYAILKDLDHPDFLRIGDELRQTVDEILERAKQMAIDYA